MFRATLLLVSLMALTGCLKEASPDHNAQVISSNIIGGEPVKKANIYSIHTAGISNREENSICTAVIIGKDLLLTAAHCVNTATEKKIAIAFGMTIFARKSALYKVKKILVHEGYKPKLSNSNDVALIRLEKDIPEAFMPVDLEDSRQLNLVADDVLLSIGYGANEVSRGSTGGGGTLRMVPKKIGVYDNAAENIVLDQSDKKGICFGDSGGPTFTLVEGKVVLVGIASFITAQKNKLADCTITSALANPNYFYTWINESTLKI